MKIQSQVSLKRALVLFAGLLLSFQSYAQDVQDAPQKNAQTEAKKKGAIGLGINTSNQPSIYKNIDDEYDLSVYLQYRGEKFNVDEESLSYKLSDSNKFQFEVLGKNENRGYKAKDSKVFAGMEDRDDSLDLGARAALKTKYGLVSIEATKDVTGTHKGHEADLRFGPDFYRNNWNGNKEISVGTVAGVKWQSKDVVNYYYGVKDSEATATRAAYKGKDALTPYIGVDLQANVSKNLTLNGSAIYVSRPDEITKSPLVDNDTDIEFKAGLTYWF